MRNFLAISLTILILATGCLVEPEIKSVDDFTYQPEPYLIEQPYGFPKVNIALDNPETVDGVALGRRLFYETKMSGDLTMSCGSCHEQAFGFTDGGMRYSEGILHIFGTRNSMPIMNLVWNRQFLWDGTRSSLRDQATGPITDPIELNVKLSTVIERLENDPDYPLLFFKAFGSTDVTVERITMALEQFQNTLVSANSRLDRFLRKEPGVTLSDTALMGLNLFRGEVVIDGMGNRIGGGADCWHCHSITGQIISDSINNVLFTDNVFHNNGLDINPADSGMYLETGDPADIGKFKTPSLRNVAVTGPYMHDGRFNTLEEVIEFYSSGVQSLGNVDPLVKTAPAGGYNFTDDEKIALVEFLKTLTDEDFLTNPAFSDPN